MTNFAHQQRSGRKKRPKKRKPRGSLGIAGDLERLLIHRQLQCLRVCGSAPRPGRTAELNERMRKLTEAERLVALERRGRLRPRCIPTNARFVGHAVPSNDRRMEISMSHGLDGRSSDEDGRIRAKRSDTRVSTLAETYPEFQDLPRNKTLRELKQQLGTESLDQTRRALRDRNK